MTEPGHASFLCDVFFLTLLQSGCNAGDEFAVGGPGDGAVRSSGEVFCPSLAIAAIVSGLDGGADAALHLQAALLDRMPNGGVKFFGQTLTGIGGIHGNGCKQIGKTVDFGRKTQFQKQGWQVGRRRF